MGPRDARRREDPRRLSSTTRRRDGGTLGRQHMPIMGLEAVVYGVDDVDTSARFLADFGLETRDSGAAGATLAVAGEGTRVELRKSNDSGLPAAVEAGPTLREIVWAVSDKAS